ncbi:MAG: 3'-5' exonuclease [Nanoarchaeota archaeon]
MISLDIETSGIDMSCCGIWQIGALEIENPENVFLQEARIDALDIIEPEALVVTEKTEEELRSRGKQSQRGLIQSFLEWRGFCEVKTALCHNPQFDIGFITLKSLKYFKKDPFWPIYHRAFDLHTLAQQRYFQENGRFLIDGDHSDMGLSKILKFVGIEDKRRAIKDGKVEREGNPHNALEDAKLTAECFSRLIYGKTIFPEYTKFKVPEYLLNPRIKNKNETNYY